MPWRVEDVEKHIKGLTQGKKQAWVKIANSARLSCMAKGKSESYCDGYAIRVANGRVRKVKEGRNMSMAVKESSQEKDMLILSPLREVAVDRDGRVIKNVVLLASQSKNNREYTSECMEKAIPMLEGVKTYLNHSRKNSRGEVRDLKDLAGIQRNVRIEDGKVKGDLHLLNTQYADLILSIAEEAPDAAGHSIHAMGRYKRRNAKDIVEALTNVASVDLVTEPGTTKGLFEQAEKTKEGDMDWKDIDVKELKANRADISEALLEEGVSSRDKEVKELSEERDALKKENDDFKVKEATAAKSARVEKALKESGLSEEAKTDTFVEILKNVQEKKDGEKVISVDEQIKTLIDDRKKISGKEGVKANTEKKVNEAKGISKEDFAAKIRT